MIKLINQIDQSIQQEYQRFLPNMNPLGIIAFLVMPAAYFVWTYIEPQQYENIYLKLIGMLTAIPVLFIHKIPKQLHNYLPYYFFGALTYNFPFIFSFMLFKNDYSHMWHLSFILSLLLLISLINQWYLVLLIFLTGVLTSTICIIMTVSETALPSLLYGLLFIYLFVFIIGGFFKYKMQTSRLQHTETHESQK